MVERSLATLGNRLKYPTPSTGSSTETAAGFAVHAYFVRSFGGVKIQANVYLPLADFSYRFPRQ